MSQIGQSLLDHHQQIYAVLYFGAICAAALWEGAAPRRRLSAPLGRRWFGNASIAIVNGALLWLAFPIMTIGFAVTAAERGWGALHLFAVPAWAAILLSVAALDLGRYLQHRLLHEIPLLWRIHRMHHTDHDTDFTTGLRFHPFEAVFATGISFCLIALIGPPVVAVVIYELIFVLVAFFAHANIALPEGADRLARYFVVTPDLHRVHHSALEPETNSNFGVVFPWWDRMFRTYVAQPSQGHVGMAIGLDDFRDRRHLTLPWMAANPFLLTRRPASAKLPT